MTTFNVRYNIKDGKVLYKIFADTQPAGVGVMSVPEFREYRGILQSGADISSGETVVTFTVDTTIFV